MKDKAILNLNHYELYVFDCDGVLLDSNQLKSKAFRLTLENYPKNFVEHFIAYHELNGGISRHIKFEYFLRNILKKQNFQEEHSSLLRKFSLVSMEILSREARLIPGVKDFLKKLNTERKYVIVCSGTDETDLKKILAIKNIDQYFSHIYGSPKTKKEILLKALTEYKNHKIQGIFFGDASSDYEAAKKFQLDFIFVSYNSDWKNISKMPYYKNLQRIHSFQYLEPLVS